MQHQSGVAGQPGGLAGAASGQLSDVDGLAGVQRVQLRLAQLQLGHAGPARVGRLAVPVLVGGQAHRRGLDAQRHVLADQRDVLALGGQRPGHGQDPAVPGVVAEPRREHRGIGVVQLDPQGTARVVDRYRLVQPAVGDPQVVEQAQALAGEVAQFRVVALAFELGDHHQREDHLVLGETQERGRVGEENGGVEDEGADGGLATTTTSGQGCSGGRHPGARCRPHPPCPGGTGSGAGPVASLVEVRAGRPPREAPGAWLNASWSKPLPAR